MAKAMLNASIDINIMLRFQEKVKSEGRSMSSYVEQLITEALGDAERVKEESAARKLARQKLNEEHGAS